MLLDYMYLKICTRVYICILENMYLSTCTWEQVLEYSLSKKKKQVQVQCNVLRRTCT